MTGSPAAGSPDRDRRNRRGSRALPLVLLFGLPLLAGLPGCGDGTPPPPEFPGFEEPRGPAELTVTLEVTFSRDEAPVRVPRTLVLPLADADAGDEALLLRVALNALVAGPTAEEEADGIFSFFSAETSELVTRVELHGDSAMVDLGDLRAAVPNAASSAGSFMFLTELNGTVFGLPGIERVEYRMEGSCEAFWAFLQRDCQQILRPAAG